MQVQIGSQIWSLDNDSAEGALRAILVAIPHREKRQLATELGAVIDHPLDLVRATLEAEAALIEYILKNQIEINLVSR